MASPKLLKRVQAHKTPKLSGVCSKLGEYSSIRCKYNSAFDPYFHLHIQNVTREQQDAFRDVWENDIGNFKKDLTEAESKLFQRKVNETTAIDEFEDLLKGLWGPKRHAFIRKTSTFEYVNDTIFSYLDSCSDSHTNALSLIFGDDNKFNEFSIKSNLHSNDSEGYLNDFIFGDLRYLCSCIAIDYLKGPPITIVFGNRKRYHFEMPNPIGRTAYWQNCIFDRCHTDELVLLTAINALKEQNGVVSPNYFKTLLDGLEHNALKEEEWRPFAESRLSQTQEEFEDDFDRAFNHFQEDAGVSKLKTRFPTDWDRFKV